jgi:Ni/Fe-hydrogenase 1 B-type cytochrome subunit
MSPAGNDLERVYVWQWPIRLVHWTLATSIAALAVTGLYISWPFFSGDHVMGWMRTIHFAASIAFALALVLRVAWMFLGSRWAKWDQLVPTTRARWRGFLAVVKYYSLPRGAYPHRAAGHNPLAGLSYLGFYLLALAVVATGLALYSAEAAIGSPMSWFGVLVPWLGGLARVRWLHHLLMWPVLLFAVIHVYIVIFVARVEGGGIVDSIITGWKIAHRENPR